MEGCQRFALLTGVSKFSKVSVFSDLNNLTDLTMDGRYSTLLGYTQEELEANFVEYIDRLVGTSGLSRSALLEKIRRWYNGYRFSKNEVTVYNPVSTMRLFDTGDFSNFWFETGTPTFLLNLIKQQQIDLVKLSQEPLSETSFSTYEVATLDARPLLVQTGYLTIKNVVVEDEDTRFLLGYPNREVEDSFNTYLAASYSGIDRGSVDGALVDLVKSLRAGNLDLFFSRLRVFFANIPYDIQVDHEKYYQSLFHVILTMIGLRVEVEVRTESGRIDAVIKTKDRIYLFEFKLHGTAEEAMEQIKAKKYAEKYLADGRPITLVGAAFDAKTRNLERWVEETIKN